MKISTDPGRLIAHTENHSMVYACGTVYVCPLSTVTTVTNVIVERQ